MEDVRIRGGWNGALMDQMSPRLRSQIQHADQQEAREAAAIERERRERAEAHQDAAVRASIEAALARGEDIDVRAALRRGGVGHTRREFVEIVSAQQDLEDAQATARRMRALRDLELGYYEQNSADTTAPGEADLAAHRELLEKREANLQARGRRLYFGRMARAAARGEIEREKERQLLRRWSA